MKRNQCNQRLFSKMFDVFVVATFVVSVSAVLFIDEPYANANRNKNYVQSNARVVGIKTDNRWKIINENSTPVILNAVGLNGNKQIQVPARTHEMINSDVQYIEIQSSFGETIGFLHFDI